MYAKTPDTAPITDRHREVHIITLHRIPHCSLCTGVLLQHRVECAWFWGAISGGRGGSSGDWLEERAGVYPVDW